MRRNAHLQYFVVNRYMGMWEQKPYKAKTFRIANETETQNKKKKKKQLTCKNKTNQKLKKKQLTRNKNEK